MEEKLSYYQKNKEIILAKRKLRRDFERDERLRLGRPFMKFDDEITFDPPLNDVICDVGEVDFVENVVEPILEPVVEPILEPVVEPVAEPVVEPVIEKKERKKSKKRVSI